MTGRERERKTVSEIKRVEEEKESGGGWRMDEVVTQVYQQLQKLVGLHRQMLEAIRAEREALVDADLAAIRSVTGIKQTVIEAIHQAESARIKAVVALALAWKKNYTNLTLPQIIIELQGDQPKAAETLQVTFQTLKILTQRIALQNQDNAAFVEKSLEHLGKMKSNILGETQQKSQVYNQRGHRQDSSSLARLLSKEI